LFYNDALIGHRALDLNWMGAIKNLHVGFMQCSLNKYANLFLNLGYRVVVVDQCETTETGILSRQISQILTKAMFESFEWTIFVVSSTDAVAVTLMTYQGL
jgi:DNA mismatch repair ATPase MutS